MANRYAMQGAGRLLGLLLMLALGVAPRASAQSAAPAFEVDVVSARAEKASDETRVDIYTKIPYTSLQFINTPNGFTARYEVAAAFYELDEGNRRRNLVLSRMWEQKVVASTFIATQADQLMDRALQSLLLKPGRYLLDIQLEDKETGETFEHEVPVRVRDLNKPVAVSDLILIDEYDAAENTITPTVASRVKTDQASFRFFYELYARRPERVRITREVIRMHTGGSALRSIFGLDRGDEDAGEVTYTKLEALPLKAGRTQLVVEIPVNELRAGEYWVRVKVEDESGRLLDMAEKVITAEWSGLAEHVQDIDEAIAQLQPIAKDRELRYIREGRTPSERASRFRAFWKKRDPTPGTERNERMEEYYYRVAYANRQYGSLTAGWKTDRGQVVILFGEPDQVERHPYNFDVKPYEVWYYYRIGRRFIFIDKTGFGDYELMVPMWDDRTRIR